ncbi:MAG TPA: hypothetical protein VFL57_02885 [Bryobacteraceae bacterium]|nr:hypothetical protein [Bryobacteraceae bacterium]
MRSYDQIACEFRDAVRQQEHTRAERLLADLAGATGENVPAVAATRELIDWALLATRTARAHYEQELTRVRRARPYCHRPRAAAIIEVCG